MGLIPGEIPQKPPLTAALQRDSCARDARVPDRGGHSSAARHWGTRPTFLLDYPYEEEELSLR